VDDILLKERSEMKKISYTEEGLKNTIKLIPSNDQKYN